MSLDWSIKEVKQYNRLYRKLEKGEEGFSETEVMKRLRQHPDRIIWYTMIIGMRDITDKNWEQFYERVRIWERVVGSNYYRTVRGKHKEVFITKDEVKRMIGLSTNASLYTPKQFQKHLFEAYRGKL